MLKRINVWLAMALIYWGSVSCIYELPQWTPDGQKIVLGCLYNNEKGNEQYQFFLLDLSSGKAQQLTQFTSDKNGICPSLSPDGKKIAFYYRDEETMGENQIELRVMDLGGSESKKVVDLQREDGKFVYASDFWSPDGKWIVFESLDPTGEKSRIFMTDLEGRKKNLTEGFFAILPSWSPDSSKIACLEVDPAKPDIYNLLVIDVNDLSKKVLARGVSMPRKHRKEVRGFMVPAWSPDGNKIAFVSGRQITIFNLTSQESRKITRGKSFKLYPRWSPKGDQIVFMKVKVFKEEPAYGDSSSEICLIHSDGSDAKVLTTFKGEAYLPQWSPSGDRVAFLFARRGEVSFLLGVVDLEGKVVFYPLNGFQKNGLASYYLSLDTEEDSGARHAQARELLDEVLKDDLKTQWAEEADKILSSMKEEEISQLDVAGTAKEDTQK